MFKIESFNLAAFQTSKSRNWVSNLLKNDRHNGPLLELGKFLNANQPTSLIESCDVLTHRGTFLHFNKVLFAIFLQSGYYWQDVATRLLWNRESTSTFLGIRNKFYE